ncbi:helix-turn-helix transcriptional regulator [Pontibaca salina]|uniref:Helix-turn-helix domain-containing protein n=1 Tax=Pontibaca salina TaxID=2795731 RepID=A0A934HPQ0_9RHOB|nr:helix-turn-helix domain-containing protein [Pontibaca salina]
MLEKHIGTAELCERIGVTRVTVHRWINNKEMGFPRPALIGGKNFWPESVIAEFFANARA